MEPLNIYLKMKSNFPKLLYHATHRKNLGSIFADGIKPAEIGVFFSDKAGNAAKFLIFKIPKEEIIAFEIETKYLDKKKLAESFDHSFEFFQCKAWVYSDLVPAEAIKNVFDFK